MRTVYKYKLTNTITELNLPACFFVVHVGMQDGAPCVWIELDTEDSTFPYDFIIHGTGHSININEEHVGTFFDTPYVWHVYYREAYV